MLLLLTLRLSGVIILCGTRHADPEHIFLAFYFPLVFSVPQLRANIRLLWGSWVSVGWPWWGSQIRHFRAGQGQMQVRRCDLVSVISDKKVQGRVWSRGSPDRDHQLWGPGASRDCDKSSRGDLYHRGSGAFLLVDWAKGRGRWQTMGLGDEWVRWCWL